MRKSIPLLRGNGCSFESRDFRRLKGKTPRRESLLYPAVAGSSTPCILLSFSLVDRFLLDVFARAHAFRTRHAPRCYVPTRHAQVRARTFLSLKAIFHGAAATSTKHIAAVTVTFTRDPLTIPTVESKYYNKK